MEIMNSGNWICKKCGSKKFYSKGVDNQHIGMYCKCCNSWYKWLSKKDIMINKAQCNENDTDVDSKLTSDLFEKEINFISDECLRDVVRNTFNAAPKCFRYISASSTGKYHPKADLGEGGLVRHTKTVAVIAYSMFRSNIFRDIVFGVGSEVSDEELSLYQDAAIAAFLIHDCCKAFDEDLDHKSQFYHPVLAANLVFKELGKYMAKQKKDNYEKEIKLAHLIYNAVSSHMGKWCTSRYTDDVEFPVPRSGLDVYVHMCDYIASRKFIDFNFDVYDGGEGL